MLVGKVFEQLDTLKMNSAHIQKVSHSKIVEFRKRNRIEAIKAGKAKADYLLEAIGEKTGKPQLVRESSLLSNQYNTNVFANTSYNNSNVGMDKLGYEEKDDVIQFQKIKITSSIYLKFGIQ